MPSDESFQLIHTAIDVLRQKRLEATMPKASGGTTSPMSLRYLERISGLDNGALSRAEEKERIPSFAFFVDWAKALGFTIEEIVQEAREQLEKDSKKQD